MTSPSRHVTAGATLEPGSTTSYNTEYLDWKVYALTALLPFVLGVAAAYSVGFALLGAGGVFAVEWWAQYESNARLAADGWSDGLEVLSYLLPIGALVATLVLVLIGGVAGSSQRKVRGRQDQYTMTLSPTTT